VIPFICCLKLRLQFAFPFSIVKVVRMVVSTYQAASGAGAAAMEELELQTREVSLLYSLLSTSAYLENSLPC